MDFPREVEEGKNPYSYTYTLDSSLKGKINELVIEAGRQNGTNQIYGGSTILSVFQSHPIFEDITAYDSGTDQSIRYFTIYAFYGANVGEFYVTIENINSSAFLHYGQRVRVLYRLKP